MSWPTVVWSMVAAACLTMALPHLLIGFRQRGARVHLFFALAAFAVAGMAAAELSIMRAATADEAGRAMEIAHVAWLRRKRRMKKAGPRVFVIDDDRSVRRSLANLLESEDHSVETFARAEEYLARAPHEGPACLVLDVRMPGLDGLALQQQLATEGRSEQIVFITGHGDIPMGIRAMKNGAVDFLPKPFDDAALLGAVAQALSRSAAAQQANGERAEVRARIALLTPREFEVFRYVIAGLLNKQIAAELDAAERTIKRHR